MANTIPGGAYQRPDGTWHDANGKAISDRVVQQFLKQQAEKQAALQQAEQNALRAQLAPLPVLVNDARMPVTAVTPTSPPPTEEDTPPAENEDEETAAPRRSRTRRS